MSKQIACDLRTMVCAFMLALMPEIVAAEIIWSGDYETGNFIQWHMQSDNTAPNFSQIPKYGRPKSDPAYSGSSSDYGDGSLLEVVTSPVRQGRYAAKFSIKNSKNGIEPDDCDVPYPTCKRRRTELHAQATLPIYYNAMPYMAERWMSVSHYVPADWDDGGSGAGPTVFQVKPLNEHGLSSTLAIVLNNRTWSIWHRWSDVKDPSSSDVPWQYQMFYSGNHEGKPYPRADSWPDGLADFPNVSTSHAALASVNKGGWTDWVIRIKYDARGSKSGGTGFATIWKREDSGPWVKVLHIIPKSTTRGNMTFDHGIGYNSPASATNPGGFGIKAGMYMAKERVWDLSANRVLYNDNIKVGSAKATFEMMSPDGSSPGSDGTSKDARPKPPKLNPIE